MMVREGRPKGTRQCDLVTTVQFLNRFRRGPRNVYQVYHGEDGSGRLTARFDIKKLYRYLRYCLNLGLLEHDHVASEGFLKAKYYRLTPKGRELINLFSGSVLPSAAFCGSS